MGVSKKPGPKPQGKVKIKWSPNFAYAIGLLASDGCLYNNGRHISLTTKDLEQATNFKECLGLTVKIGRKGSGASKEKKYYHVQFGDVLFVEFLKSIGIGSRKSKTIAEVKIPKKYFWDYTRGYFDGDGSSYSYWDKRWNASFMYYISFTSASSQYINWLRSEISERIGVNGHISIATKKLCYQLKYAKRESNQVIHHMYYDKSVMCLKRKRLKLEACLAIVGVKL